jgi:hypothetical protein
MTYYKYTHFLMYEDGLEYDTTFTRPETQHHFLVCTTAKSAAGALLRNPRRQTITTLTRQHKDQSAGDWP